MEGNPKRTVPYVPPWLEGSTSVARYMPNIAGSISSGSISSGGSSGDTNVQLQPDHHRHLLVQPSSARLHALAEMLSLNKDAFPRLQPNQQLVGSAIPILVSAAAPPLPRAAKGSSCSSKGKEYKGNSFSQSSQSHHGPTRGKRRKINGAAAGGNAPRTTTVSRANGDSMDGWKSREAARSRVKENDTCSIKNGKTKSGTVTAEAADLRTPAWEPYDGHGHGHGHGHYSTPAGSSSSLSRRRSGSIGSTASLKQAKLPANLQVWCDRWCAAPSSSSASSASSASSTSSASLGIGAAKARMPEVAIFERVSGTEIEKLCTKLLEAELTSLQVTQVCNDLSKIPGIPSYSTSAALVRTVAMPALVGLEQRASRTLVTACAALAKKLPQAFLDAAVVPLLAGGVINAHQRDALTRLMKECYKGLAAEQVVSKMLAAIPTATAAAAAAAGTASVASETLGDGRAGKAGASPAAGGECIASGRDGGPWSDEVVQVVHGLLQGCPPLSDGILALLTTNLAEHAESRAASLKYATFVILLVNKYQRQLLQCRPQLEKIVDHHTTFLKRTLNAALAKLEKMKI